MLAGAAFVTVALLGCGDIDPGKNGGTGAAASAGEGSGGSLAGEGSGGSAGSEALGGAGAAGVLAPLLPWAVGNSWTYQVTKDGVVTLKTTTIGEEETIGGKGPNKAATAFHVTTAKGADSSDHTESWQAPSADNPERIVRYREQSFSATTGFLQLEEHWDPEKLHVDGTREHTVKAASWLESYDETKLEVGLPATTHAVRERWTVIDDDETLEVPACTFEHVIHFQKAGGGSSKEYWYAREVGKLKETGSQTEELTEYSLEAAP